MKFLIALLTITFAISISYSQTNTFKLGFTGAYPNEFAYASNSGVNWQWYRDLNLNTWSGWWIGEHRLSVLDNLNSYGMDGLFMPDTIRWAGLGRQIIIRAAETQTRFRYNYKLCGEEVEDNSQWGHGQTVMFYDKNSTCLNWNFDDMGPMTILSGAEENGIQSFCAFPYDPIKEVTFPYIDDNGNIQTHEAPNSYYIKPVMRIDRDIALYSDPPIDVIKLIIKAYNGDPVKEIIIRSNDFRYNNSQTYDGRYLEDYFLNNMVIGGDRSATGINKGRAGDSSPIGRWGECHADYQIQWYGKVNVWIDYVIVRDQAAEKLLNPDTTINGQTRNAIKRKLLSIGTSQNLGRMKGFYMEEIDYHNLACLKFLNDSMPVWGSNPNFKMIGLVAPWSYGAALRNRIQIQDYKDYLIQVNPPFLMSPQYPFESPFVPTAYSVFYPRIPNNVTYDLNQNVYPYWVIDGFDQYFDKQTNPYGIVVSPSQYNTYTQNIWNALKDSIKLMSNISREYGKEYYFVPQVHYLMGRDVQTNFYSLIHKEPMNSEISAEFCIGLCNGVHGILPYAYESGYWNQSWQTDMFNGGGLSVGLNDSFPDTYLHVADHTYGMTNFSENTNWGYNKRTHNFYGENKWDYVKGLYSKMASWGPIIAGSNTTDGYSIASEGANYHFISNIISIDPNINGQNSCVDAGINIWADCPDQRFWEMGFFYPQSTQTGDASKYVMFVNRRCVPAGGNYAGDDRVLRICFNGANLTGYTNWQISEVGGVNGNRGIVFSVNNSGYIDLGGSTGQMGRFSPGEGKLFKIQPVIQSGGTLIADEVIDGVNFTCEDTVWNDGYDITFKGNGNTISFTDSATIIMNGGTFQCDSASHGQQTTKNTFQSATSGHKWSGLQLNNANVKIYNSQFQDINSPVGGNYAINCTDCLLNDIRYNTFISSTDTAGGVNIALTSALIFQPYNTYYAYVMNNIFTMNNSYSRAVQLQSYAGLTVGAYIENNSMTSNGYATGILVSTVTGGVIKNNTISGFATGINTLLSSCDLYGNTITNTGSEGKGIFAADLSFINLAPTSSGEWTGGINYISSAGNGSANLSIDNSAFYISGGYNTFDIDSTKEYVPYHLLGSFWEADYMPYAKIDGNCFKYNESAIYEPIWPHVSLTTFSNSPVDLNIFPYICDGTPPTNYDLVDIGNGINDTIPNPSGMGGGESSVSSLNPKSISDSINIQMRHRNYNTVKNLCYELINAYPDSAQSISSLQTLFMASIATDTTQTSYGNLKSYYENLILNHGSNGAMVKISNYMVQKCKVLLRQYSSALAGFQQIINNNQYNYEGLVARWDYMATTLLMNGQGGGENSIENYELGIVNESDEFDKFDESDGLTGDKTPLTKDQRITIKKCIDRTLDGSKRKDVEKIDVLKEKTKKGDKTAEHELLQRNALKNINRTERPKNIAEHLKIVNGDIQKIFGNHEPLKKDPKNQIPMVYNLYQNFPNPFNPSTKINFDLPKDSKVTLTVYDILGRVVKKLVNSEFKQAGRYSIDFNGINCASGVYFYRIEAGDYVMSKKMVLIK